MTINITKAFRSKKQLVYEAIRTAILRCELEPGARLVIDDLAQRLDVSPGPVRESLAQLQAEGLVDAGPHGSVTVSRLDARSIREIFDLLQALEIISMREACHKMSDADLDEIEGLLKAMDRRLDDPEFFLQSELRLHWRICDLAGLVLVGNFLGRTNDHWDRLRRYYLRDVWAGRIPATHRGHWRLLEALRARDADRAEQIIRDQIRSACKAYITELEARGNHTAVANGERRDTPSNPGAAVDVRNQIQA